MNTIIADQKKRVVLPNARPVDVFAVNQDPAGRLILVRLLRGKPKRRLRAGQVVKALHESPLRPTLSWGSTEARDEGGAIALYAEKIIRKNH